MISREILSGIIISGHLSKHSNLDDYIDKIKAAFDRDASSNGLNIEVVCKTPRVYSVRMNQKIRVLLTFIDLPSGEKAG